MRRLAWLAVLLSFPVAADSTVPDPPDGSWTRRCVERLERAQQEAPEFASGRIVLERKGVRFEADLADAEHARFFDGAPARYRLRVVEKKSQEPGTLGGDVGTPNDSQASLSLSQWTRRRMGTMEVQIAKGRTVFLFNRVFRPAMEECLR